MRIPLVIPERIKMEGIWGVASQGHGKTQAIQAQIADLLPRVAKGECSIMVMDSQGLASDRMIAKIKNLKVFAPGQPLHNRLIHLDPRQLSHPVALNFLDVSQYLHGMSELDRLTTINSTVRALNYLIGGIMGADFTARQASFFEYLITFLITAVPDATIFTLRDLLRPGAEQKFERYYPKLNPVLRDFFENDFADKPRQKGQYADVKEQVLRRLQSILINPIFLRMMSPTRTKINLTYELDRGTVVLIDTAQDIVFDACEILGRFWITQLALVSQRRGKAGSKLTPVYVFIDEFQQYGRSGEKNIISLLEECRKAFISLSLWHQRIDQVPETMQNALSSTGIKYVGSVEHPMQVAKWASMLRCDPEMIRRQPRFSWTTYIRGLTDRAVSVRFPPLVMENMPTMTAAEAATIAAEMRDRYCTPYVEPVSSAPAGDAGLDPNAPVKPAKW